MRIAWCLAALSTLALGSCRSELPQPCAGAPAIRRLTGAQLDATFSEATGRNVTISDRLAREDAQAGYFSHAQLTVSGLFADQLDAATGELALEVARAQRCEPAEGERPCAARLLASLARKSWRRPATDSELEELLQLFDAGRTEEDFATGLSLSVQAVLEATGSLYRTELGAPQGSAAAPLALTEWEIASALSFLATGRPPDGPLLDAAARGQLRLGPVRRQHLQRLLATPAAVRHLREFVEQWFGMSAVDRIQKNNEYLPKFSVLLRDDLATSSRKFIESALSGSRGRVSELLLGQYTFANDSVAEFLDSPQRPGPTFQRLSTSGLPRQGLLTQPGWLAVFGHNDDGSPVLRGQLIRTRLLCEDVPPPPPNVVASAAPASPTSTTRERAEVHLAGSCAVCHRLLDPIGFGLEAYDGLGGWRATEAQKAIDDRGEIIGSDVPGSFVGALELTQRLAQSAQLRRCSVTQLFQFGAGRAAAPSDSCITTAMEERFTEAGGSLYAALEAWVESESFVVREVPR